MAKPPSSLPPSGSAPLHVSLILGSFAHSPATIDLFDLYIPSSAPAYVHPEEALYHPRPEIVHTFHPDPILPPRPISALFAALVLAPWAVLFVLVRDVPFPLHVARFRALLTIVPWSCSSVGCCAPRRSTPLLA
jgi:oligosaccharyltransferase complex subunit delta (ribophorin II)